VILTAKRTMPRKKEKTTSAKIEDKSQVLEVEKQNIKKQQNTCTQEEKKKKKMVISDVKIKWQLNQTPEERKTMA
jgi:hypothetical protein